MKKINYENLEKFIYFNKKLDYMNEEDKDKLYRNSIKSFGLLEHLRKNKVKKTLLAVGKVQSGKTNNILSFINIALDLKYDFICIFGGVNNKLNDQSKKRFFSSFVRTDKNDHIKWMNNQYIKKIKYYDEDKTHLFIGLKGKVCLENVINFIRMFSLRKKKVLIIDDEADYASTPKSELKKSSIHNLISKIISYNVDYISLTATPYSNLMLDNLDTSPNALIALETSNKYTGLKYFKENAPNIYKVINTDWDVNEKSDFFSIINKFMVHSVLHSLKYPGNRKYQILINDSVKKIDMKNTKIHILKILNYIAKKIRQNTSEFENKIKVLFNNVSEELKINILKKNKLNSFKLYIEFFKEMTKVEPIILNQDSENKEVNKDKIEIIIGGLLMSRGYTFDNLLFQVITNTPKEKYFFDTMLQKCRWFGYRDIDNRVKFMKIYLSKKTKENLDNILLANNKIDTMIENNKLTPKNIKQLISDEETDIFKNLSVKK